MTEIAAKKLYVGDELVYEKPEMKIICATKWYVGSAESGIIFPQNPDFSSENITITVINKDKYFTKTFKTSEWLTGVPKLAGRFSTGQIIEESDGTKDTFELHYAQNSSLPAIYANTTESLMVIIYKP